MISIPLLLVGTLTLISLLAWRGLGVRRANDQNAASVSPRTDLILAVPATLFAGASVYALASDGNFRKVNLTVVVWCALVSFIAIGLWFSVLADLFPSIRGTRLGIGIFVVSFAIGLGLIMISQFAHFYPTE